MAYRKYKLGDLVEQYDEINQNGEFTKIEDLQGINSNKYFQECKSNKNDIDLLRYRICRHGMFSYNRATSRNGEKISIALRTGDDCLVSPSYYCFRIKDEEVLCPEYLDIWFKRPVFDKYARFNSWGSATEFFAFDDFCATEIMLPPLPEQRKIVHDYKVITDRIELLRKMNETLEEQEDAIFQDFYSDDSLNEGHFSDLVVDNIPGDWGSDSATGNTNAQVTCIRGADIPRLANGGTDNAPTRYILQKNYLSKSLPANALIIEISGGSPTQSTGRIALLTDELRAKLNSRVICSNFCKAITVKKDFLYFFYLAWRHLYKANRLFDYENSTIGLKNFDYQSFVTQEAIRIPTAEGGRRLNAMIEPIRKAIILNGFESEKLMTLQTVVLPNIMR